ncbi:MAG: ExbD/TolR family protein [Burkholderiaceae bacterium]
MAQLASGSMRGGRGRKFKAEINVVPYIDVMLVLLIIFMIAAPITNPGVINLPTAAKSTLPPTEYIQVAMKADTTATLSINAPKGPAKPPETAANRRILLLKLRAMHEYQPDLPLMISADKDIRYDEVIQVISEAKKMGITRVGLATVQ